MSTHGWGGHEVTDGLRRGLRVSEASLAWTILAGSAAVTIGVTGNSLVLVTFGSVGLLDAIGSASLIVHFRHSRARAAISERHERLALAGVTLGMATIGVATIADSGYRICTHATSHPLTVGIVLAAASVVVLGVLAVGKRRISRRIPSHALHADGWLSAIGSLLAAVTLTGTALNAAFGWWWIDPLAAMAVACGAIGLSVALLRGPDLGDRGEPGPP